VTLLKERVVNNTFYILQKTGTHLYLAGSTRGGTFLSARKTPTLWKENELKRALESLRSIGRGRVEQNHCKDRIKRDLKDLSDGKEEMKVILEDLKGQPSERSKKAITPLLEKSLREVRSRKKELEKWISFTEKDIEDLRKRLLQALSLEDDGEYVAIQVVLADSQRTGFTLKGGRVKESQI